MDRKQSQFTSVDTLSESDFIPSFGQSTNKKISKPDLFKQIKDETQIFIYPTIEQLQSANLTADSDWPIYVRVEETEYKLYKITTLASGVDDISLNNGATATYQTEYSEIGFVVGPETSANNAIAIFDGVTGTQLKNGPTISAIGSSLIQAPNVSDTSYARINSDDTVTLRNTSQHKQDLLLGNVDNTSDINKPLSNAAIAALDLKAPLSDPVFTGNPRAPTPPANDNDTSIATTAYVQTELLDRPQVIENVAALSTFTPVVGQVYKIKEYHAGTGKGGGDVVGKAGSITPNNVTTFSATSGFYFERINYDVLTAEMGGARGDGTTNDLPAIQAMIDKFTGGQKILFPSAQYRITGTLYPKFQGIYLEGAGVYATELIYDAPGGTMIKANVGTTIINSAGISKMTLRGTNPTNSPDFVVDLSGFSYCSFKELELVTTRPNGKIWRAYSDLGTAPYFNVIDDFTMFGGLDATQEGFSFVAGSWDGGSRGGNANIISNLKRAAGLKTLIDIQDGQGNIFNNIVGESINTDFIKLNDVPSYADTGTITGFTQNTLTDSSKSWSISPDQIYVNYSVLITGGVGAGQCRHIGSHTANTLSLSSPWGVSLQAGSSTYAIVRFGAVDNIFSNIRQEGNGGNFIKCLPGAIGNRLTDAVVSGVVTVVNDLSGDPTNHLSNGELVMLHEVIRDIGASANLDIWPRVSNLGGLPVGRSYSIEFLQVNCPGIVTGTATITLDAGGTTVGAGSPTVRCVLDSVLATGAISSPVNKSAKSSQNNNLFLNITTSAAMNPTTDFTIVIALRVH